MQLLRDIMRSIIIIMTVVTSLLLALSVLQRLFLCFLKFNNLQIIGIALKQVEKYHLPRQAHQLVLLVILCIFLLDIAMMDLLQL